MSPDSNPDQRGIVSCPTCNTPVSWTPDQPWRPFCSERCKLIDLGEWLSEDKRIPGEPAGESVPRPDPDADPY